MSHSARGSNRRGGSSVTRGCVDMYHFNYFLQNAKDKEGKRRTAFHTDALKVEYGRALEERQQKFGESLDGIMEDHASLGNFNDWASNQGWGRRNAGSFDSSSSSGFLDRDYSYPTSPQGHFPGLLGPTMNNGGGEGSLLLQQLLRGRMSERGTTPSSGQGRSSGDGRVGSLNESPSFGRTSAPLTESSPQPPSSTRASSLVIPRRCSTPMGTSPSHSRPSDPQPPQASPTARGQRNRGRSMDMVGEVFTVVMGNKLEYRGHTEMSTRSSSGPTQWRPFCPSPVPWEKRMGPQSKLQGPEDNQEAKSAPLPTVRAPIPPTEPRGPVVEAGFPRAPRRRGQQLQNGKEKSPPTAYGLAFSLPASAEPTARWNASEEPDVSPGYLVDVMDRPRPSHVQGSSVGQTDASGELFTEDWCPPVPDVEPSSDEPPMSQNDRSEHKVARSELSHELGQVQFSPSEQECLEFMKIGDDMNSFTSVDENRSSIMSVRPAKESTEKILPAATLSESCDTHVFKRNSNPSNSRTPIEGGPLSSLTASPPQNARPKNGRSGGVRNVDLSKYFETSSRASVGLEGEGSKAVAEAGIIRGLMSHLFPARKVENPNESDEEEDENEDEKNMERPPMVHKTHALPPAVQNMTAAEVAKMRRPKITADILRNEGCWGGACPQESTLLDRLNARFNGASGAHGTSNK